MRKVNIGVAEFYNDGGNVRLPR